MIAQILRELIAAGLQGEALVSAIERIEAAMPLPVDATAERRRARDRERYRQNHTNTPEPQEIPKPPFPPKSTENTGENGEVLILTKKDKINKVKKVSVRKLPLPDDWKPNEKHFAKAQELHIPESAVWAKAEDMRNWAHANGILKVDWDATFMGFLRRDAEKLAAYPTQKKDEIKTDEEIQAILDGIRRMKDDPSQPQEGTGIRQRGNGPRGEMEKTKSGSASQPAVLPSGVPGMERLGNVLPKSLGVRTSSDETDTDGQKSIFHDADTMAGRI